MTGRARLFAAVLAAALSVGLGVAAAWPIYRTGLLLLPAVAALVLGTGIAVAAHRWRWPAWSVVLVVLAVFALTVVPVAETQRLSALLAGSGGASADLLPGLVRALVDGLAAVVLGWKQLLTLTLPVGGYQTVLVPAYLVFLSSTLLAVRASLRGGRIASLAAGPLLAPVAFGSLFGAADASAPSRIGPLTIAAPREVALWCAAALLAGLWVVWSSGAQRRAALRRGREAAPRGPGLRIRTRGRAGRLGIATATLALALAAALLVTPALGAMQGGERQALRDDVDPEIVLRERPSPLAAYRVFKRDDALDAPLFSVSAEGAPPGRLRLAVLDAYDGVDFHVGDEETERFTRFPSGTAVEEPVSVTVSVEEGYADIWVPLAGLGSVPEFSGPRAGSLAEAFFVNRSTGAAIAVPPAGTEAAADAGGDAGSTASKAPAAAVVDAEDGGSGGRGETGGLRTGDGYRMTMSGAKDPVLIAAPASSGPEIDLDAMPELAEWLRAQDQPETAEGLTELIHRLRSRGYLSHALSNGAGDRLWLERLRDAYGASFSPSPGGHSIARVEQLFAQLNAQQRAADPGAREEALVAGVGDDEQFAAAAALLARALGFDSRVVLGVRLGEAASIPGVPACVDVCTGENLAAWIEVRGEDGRWAPLDATPQVTHRPSTPSEGQRLPEHPTTPEQRDAHEVDPPVGVGEPADDARPIPPQRAESSIWALLRAIALCVAAVLLLALPLLFLPSAKRLRTRRRRREPHPELRALGAWHEAVDLALDFRLCTPEQAGLSVRGGESGGALGRTDLARHLAGAGLAFAPALAAEVDDAVFSASGAADEQVDRMWERFEAERAAFLAERTRRRRLLARYSLRSYGIGFAVHRRGRGESAVHSTAREHGRRGRGSSSAAPRRRRERTRKVPS